MQLMVQFQRIFRQAGVPVKVITYRILAISPISGLIEPIPNSVSLDTLKKRHTNLLNFFLQAFGEPSEALFKQAQKPGGPSEQRFWEIEEALRKKAAEAALERVGRRRPRR